MRGCSNCPRVICHRCLTWPTDSPENWNFVCPFCHDHDKTGKKKDPSPYLVGLSSASEEGD